MAEIHVPVLVAGAGPTGLMMACELRRRGIDCRIIDKLAEPSDKSKALVVHARTMELFEIMGISNSFVAKGEKIHGASMFSNGKRIVHLNFDELNSPFPYALGIPQNQTEALLHQQLKSLGTDVERAVELLKFEQNSDSVTATLKHADGHEEQVTCQYLIGCDGAHSSVRKGLNVPFQGSAYEDWFALADVAVDWTHHSDELTTFLDEKLRIAFFPMPGGRFRLIIDGIEAPAEGTAPTLEQIQAWADEHVVGKCKLTDPRWLTYFKISRRSVGNYREGRTFLAGDAGHIHSPVGGQGMNTGLQDAFNLAWKLALTLKGQAPESLLDTYQQERHPVAEELLKGTDMATKVAFIRNPVAQKIRNVLAHTLLGLEVVQQRLIKTGAMLTVNYRHSPIVGEYRAQLPGSAHKFQNQVGSWIDFHHGPSPGFRGPDAEFRSGESEEKTLFDVISGTSHNLLLFVGLHESEAAFARLEKIAAYVASQYGELVKVHIVVPDVAIAAGNTTKADILDDCDKLLHKAYGAGWECLYLLRPDGYVGFRSQPTDQAALDKHLSSILLKQKVKV